MDSVETIIIGAGVVGLAVAAQLSQYQSNVVIVDKNATFGEETSSRNSEVIHAGIYYPKNSLKAKLSVAGKQALYEYCRQRHIPFKPLGKLIVAQGPDEEEYLQQLVENACANGVTDLSWQSRKALSQKSPELSASAALLSPSTGILDVHAYMQSLLAQAQENEALFVGKTRMLSAQPNDNGFRVTLDSQGEITSLQCRYLINCAGLHSQQLALNIQGVSAKSIPVIHWCRGHYFSYQGKSPFGQLIYPVPETNTVGLGIHATLDMAGQLRFGPDSQYIDSLDYRVDPGLKAKFARAIRRYFPGLDPNKLQPAYSGIRPKLQGPGQGFQDFVIQDSRQHGLEGLIQLFGIESPGITASLAIAKEVTQRLHLG